MRWFAGFGLVAVLATGCGGDKGFQFAGKITLGRGGEVAILDTGNDGDRVVTAGEDGWSGSCAARNGKLELTVAAPNGELRRVDVVAANELQTRSELSVTAHDTDLVGECATAIRSTYADPAERGEFAGEIAITGCELEEVASLDLALHVRGCEAD